jgi:hypothetical protein
MEDEFQFKLTPVPPEPVEVEDEDDLEKGELRELSKTVVAASDWTTETIIRQLDRGNIDINPAFQRRDAWTLARKSKFIESLILGLPIPQLVLAESKRKKGAFIVIDGKQRLLTLRQFAAKPGDKSYESLKLQDLEVRDDLNGCTLQDIETNPALAEDLAVFQNQTIRTVVIKNWPNETVLFLIFLRLNTSSVPLSPQELRQALHPGPFLSFVDERSAKMTGLQKLLNVTKPDFRMRDAELLVRYFAFKNFLPKYRGNLKMFLDDTCAQLNDRWVAMEAALNEQVDDLEKAIEACYEIFGERNAFRKWEGEDYERRFNRAVFDIMVFFFSQPKVRQKATGKARQIAEDFEKLCEVDQEFRRSIETTTKSTEATVTRLNHWGVILSKRLKIPLSVPRLNGKNISLK